MWATGAREHSLEFVRRFATSLAKDIEHESSDSVPKSLVSKTRLDEYNKLLARCYFKQGQWQKELKEDWNQVRYFPLHPSRLRSNQRNALGKHRRHTTFFPVSNLS